MLVPTALESEVTSVTSVQTDVAVEAVLEGQQFAAASPASASSYPSVDRRQASDPTQVPNGFAPQLAAVGLCVELARLVLVEVVVVVVEPPPHQPPPPPPAPRQHVVVVAWAGRVVCVATLLRFSASNVVCHVTWACS